MNKRVFLLAIFSLFFFSLISAQPPFQQTTIINQGLTIETPIISYHKTNTDFKFHVHVHNASNGLLLRNDSVYCIVHLYNSTGEHLVENNMSWNGNNYDFEYTILAGNFSEPEQMAILFYCEAPGDIGGFFEYGFDTTTNGQEPSYSFLIAMVVLLLTFLGIGFLIKKDKDKMSDEQYWNKMVTKWKDKNYVRFSAIVLWYNMKKNSYVFYYLIGWIMIILIYDITLIYNLTSTISIFRIFLSLYSWGAMFIAIILFGNVQEWIMEWKEELEKINWGDLTNGKQ